MTEHTDHPPSDAALPEHAIAVVGLAGRFPGARDLDDFWRQVSEGVEVLEELTDADLDAAGVSTEQRNQAGYVRRGTFLERCEEFDAGFFGYAPREAQVLDPQHRVFLECAAEALEHGGYAAGTAGLPESVGVYAGASMNTYLSGRILRNPTLAAAVGGYQLMLANDKDYLCTRVSYKLGLKGPSMTVQTACSTSLVAVQVACRALQRGECDMALAGGVSILFPQRAGYLYHEGMILSPDGHCRPFDEAARGTRAGAGAGVVVLKRLDQALADGDTVHAVIRGIAVNNDGADKAGFTAPSVEGQVEVIATAQALAGVDARSITYLEAHGTATPLGDPIEVEALTQVFRADTEDLGWCRLGSLKAQLGHLDAAAGVAGLIKAVLALSHRELPPLANFGRPNPALQLEQSPFHASARKAPWEPPPGLPRRAGVSSFGIGGTNAHAVLEEAPAALPRRQTAGPQILVCSARSESALEAATTRLARHLQQHPEQDLADVAHTLQVGRKAFAHRSALVVSGREQALAVLSEPQRFGLLTARHEGGTRPVAMLFSGQGSQHAGMGRGLYEREPVYREVVDGCAALLRQHLDADIRELIFDPAQAGRLNDTRFTQPALFVTELALATLWQARGITPAAMLGHSIGEYVAAHLAGVMTLPDALAVVAARGRLMQQQPVGAMAAVHLAADQLQRWLDSEPGVEVAAVNAPRLCTLAGPTPALQALVTRLTAAGVDTRPLQTSHAFHSAMMAPATAPFMAVLERIALAPPTRPCISNVTGTWITPEQATSPAYWAEHMRRPVLFAAGLRTLAADASLQFLEVGPGHALTALARLNLGAEGPRRSVASMRRPSDNRPDDEMLLDATARLWLAGCGIQWPGLHGAAPRRRVPLPTYPFERRRHAVDPAPQAAQAASAATRATEEAAVPRSSRIDDWFYAPTWSRDDAVPSAPVVPAPGKDGAARWLVLGDEGPLSQALANELTRRGFEVLRAHASERFEGAGPATWRVRPGASDDLRRLLAEAAAAPLTGLVHLWGLPGIPGQRITPEQVYDSLITLGTSLPASPGGAPVRLLHVSAGAESVLGEAVRDARLALATGPVLALPTELPGMQMRAIDLDPADLAAAALPRTVAALADEAQHDANEPQVARRAGRRWVRRYERLQLPAASNERLPLRHEGCYLVTGGLGGMGLAIARWLGLGLRARLVLTARQALPAREAWDEWIATHDAGERQAQAITAIREIEAAGGEVLVASADVADERAMAAVLARARARFGALHGVFHGAGVSGLGHIAQRSTPQAARAVFAPKVEGLAVLARLLGRDTLDIVVLIGSIGAVIGSPGTCDYAAANAVFDAFVDSAVRPAGWRQMVAVDWGAWRDVGMAARLEVPDTLRARWAAHVAGAIAPAAGIEALARVLASRRRRVVVETYDVVRGHEMMRRPQAIAGAAVSASAEATAPAASAGTEASQEASARAGTNPRPPLSTPFVAPTNCVEQRLAAIWEELLGVQGIGIHDDFFELGGHSLMFTRVLARVDDHFGAKLPLHELFDVATIKGLADKLPLAAAERNSEREVMEF